MLLVVNVTVEQMLAIEELFRLQQWILTNLVEHLTENVKEKLLAWKQDLNLQMSAESQHSLKQSSNTKQEDGLKPGPVVKATDLNVKPGPVLKVTDLNVPDNNKDIKHSTAHSFDDHASNSEQEHHINESVTISGEIACSGAMISMLSDIDTPKDARADNSVTETDHTDETSKFNDGIGKKMFMELCVCDVDALNKTVEGEFESEVSDVKDSNRDKGAGNKVNDIDDTDYDTDEGNNRIGNELFVAQVDGNSETVEPDCWIDKDKINDMEQSIDRDFKTTDSCKAQCVRKNMDDTLQENLDQTVNKCLIQNKVDKVVRWEPNSQYVKHGGKFCCTKCSRVFKSKTGIYNHVKGNHEKEFNYKCKICDKTFLFKPHYIGHMNKHGECKPSVCSACGKSFRYKQTLTLHTKSCKVTEETGVTVNSYKNYQNYKTRKARSRVLCDLCGVDLSSKSALKQHHSYVHSDRPKQICHDCGKSFKTETTLKRHLQVSHQGERSYSCTLCRMVFKQAEVLRQHIQRHKKQFSIYCKTCGKGFYTQFKLTEHERMHTGEKPFTCSVCLTFKCSTKSNLLKHLRIHEKQKNRSVSRKPNVTKLDDCDEKVGNRFTQQGVKQTCDKAAITHVAQLKPVTNEIQAIGHVTTSISQSESCHHQDLSNGNVYANMTSVRIEGGSYGTNLHSELKGSDNLEYYHSNKHYHSNSKEGQSLTAVLSYVSPSQY